MTANGSLSHTGKKHPYYHCQENSCSRLRKKDAENIYLNYLKTLKPKAGISWRSS
jgi:hypothetical protein